MFEKVKNLLVDELNVEESSITLEAELDETENSRARFFPTTGGVLKTMAQDAPGYTYIALDGVENCIDALKDIESGKIHKCFIEMSACVGSCIGGPVMEKYHRTSAIKDYITISNYETRKRKYIYIL